MPLPCARRRGRKPPTRANAAALTAAMPPLAGEPLEPPRFEETGWKVGQVFTEADDPDRARLTWQPPAFACKPRCAGPCAETRAEDLQLQPRHLACGSFARVVRGVLSEKDCADLIRHVNAKGFTPALVNIGHNRQKLMPDFRDGHRVIVDSRELAGWLLEALRPHLPERLEDGSRLVELNERLRFLCYTPGQAFESHLDGEYCRPPGHPRAGDRSWITVQVYLHDVPETHGGATTFFPDCAFSVKHQPEVGSVLLFTQNLLHEGSFVRAGLKYTLRTEAMYALPSRRTP